MSIRPKQLWRVPVFCAVASFFSFMITVYIGGPFFTVQTPMADGSIHLSADPVRSFVFDLFLFVLFLLLGGLWAFRSMTKGEIAVSAAIASVIWLVLILCQMYLPGFPVTLSFNLAYIQNLGGIFASILYQAVGNIQICTLLSAFYPFLFIPFGKKTAK